MALQEPLTTDNTVLRSLSDSRRRRILLLLLDRTSPVGLRELATNIAAEERDVPLVDVTRGEVEEVCGDLIHTQLPTLEEPDLVRWNRAEETVTTTDHPALRDPKLQRMIETGRDDVLVALANDRRRIILSILKDYEGAMARAELAKEIVARTSDVEGIRPTDAADDLLVELHHVHFPKLHQAGLVSYDTDRGTASYQGHPALADEWLDARGDESPLAILPTARTSDASWTIEGRDNVVAQGQSLFERAENELFLMFTTDGLLEDGCIRRLQDAVDRGVDVYLGSQTREVRDRVREHVPGAVLWEPQMDWLNPPPEYEKVGRLVFADREAIMLATLGEETGASTHAETAITGAGKNDPLVVLMREMLGPRLDHLDAQSEDFLSEIPL